MEQIQSLIQAGKIAEAIRETEAKLTQLPETDFHRIIGKDLLRLQSGLVKFLDEFYEAMTTEEELDISLLYIEMNSFSVEYKRWYLRLYCYEAIQGTASLDWLQEFSGESENMLTITGYESLQVANQKYMQSEGYRDNDLRQACELHEHLVILRLHELVKHTVEAQKGIAAWASIPLFAGAKDFEDLIYIERQGQ